MQEALARVREELQARRIELTLLPGGELDFDQLGRQSPEELSRFALAGNPRYLLVEFPYSGWPLRLPSEVERLIRAGITPVLAHPERNRAVAERPTSLVEMVAAGALVQVTASSVTGGFGKRVRAVARQLLDAGLVHLIATDIHAPELGRAGLAAAAASLSNDSLARWLVHDVPAAIVNDTPLPPRPSARAKERRRLLRRR
jgi:protein-tyrosine phosphatase